MTAARPAPSDPQLARELLSSVVDGECRADVVEDACRRWRADDELRTDWHVYHLIGDVLRSDELSADTRRDAAFLQGLRARMANEPVPFAPQALAAPRRRWLAPAAVAAVAAGFVMVGTAVLVLRPESTAPTGWTERMAIAVQPSDGMPVRRVSSAAVPASGQSLLIDSQLIRDARLDAYFEAHRGAVGPLPSAVPGGALRSVEILVPQR